MNLQFSVGGAQPPTEFFIFVHIKTTTLDFTGFSSLQGRSSITVGIGDGFNRISNDCIW